MATAQPSAAESAPKTRTARPNALAGWLLAVAALVFLMVVVGGITRLTESGLSITEWKPVTGALPPIGEAAWQEAFAKYRQTTEFQTEHRWMTLSDFQFIFFWEWAHRLLGRLIGLAFALPLAWFAWRRAIPAGYGPRLVALLALGGLQGAVGWWMVSSGLVGRTDVSHYRLAVHLMLALFILGGLVWTACDLRTLARDPAARPARMRWGTALLLLLLAIQLLWGAYTAGLNAGYAFSSWPKMGDEWFPAGAIVVPGAANLVDNPIVVQFIHRWFAWVAAGAMIVLGVRALRRGGRVGAVLHGLIVLQIALGIATLLTGVQLWVAVAHQGVAALIVAAAAASAHRASRAPEYS